jgi:hypothetical protein
LPLLFFLTRLDHGILRDGFFDTLFFFFFFFFFLAKANPDGGEKKDIYDALHRSYRRPAKISNYQAYCNRRNW